MLFRSHEITGAPVFEGELDFNACLAAWAPPANKRRFSGLLEAHGFDMDVAAGAQASDEILAANVRHHAAPLFVDEGDVVDGWDVIHLPGHAPGHLVLMRDNVMISGDVLLNRITPNISRDLQSGPDPLARYLETLDRIALIAPERTYPGHGSPIENPAERAGEIKLHHDERLAITLSALDAGPRTAYESSYTVFPDDLPPFLRRFAFLETLAHLEYLALKGDIQRIEAPGQPIQYTAE